MLFEDKHSGSNYFTLLHYEDFKCILHCQKSFEIVYVEQGMLEAEIHGQIHPVPAGYCAMILPFQIHSFRTPVTSKITIAIFSTDFIPDFSEAAKTQEPVQPVSPYPPDELDVLARSELIYGRKAMLYRRCAALEQNGFRHASHPIDAALMTRILSFIQEHYREAISLAQLALHLGYSYNYLSSYFKKYLGRSFSEYINVFRVEDAARLLHSTSLPLTEVASLSGFSTIRNFNTVFKKHFQMAPSHYRKQSRDAVSHVQTSAKAAGQK
ncbi:MAG: helix-turn-helix transcriptional regulator [Clostridia bacterium]|nr:helix-turn-helix transcriptional regulator [Clostridia bacterium]